MTCGMCNVGKNRMPNDYYSMQMQMHREYIPPSYVVDRRVKQSPRRRRNSITNMRSMRFVRDYLAMVDRARARLF